MKKFLIGALTALTVVGFGAFTEAAQADYDNTCCRGNYCYTQDSDNCNGDYCGRYGCGDGYGRGYGRGGYGCYR